MKKYLAIKNALLTLVVSTIYYKSIFAEATVFMRIAGTIVIFVALMGLLQNADDCFMNTINYSEKEKSASVGKP